MHVTSRVLLAVICVRTNIVARPHATTAWRLGMRRNISVSGHVENEIMGAVQPFTTSIAEHSLVYTTEPTFSQIQTSNDPG